MASNLIVEVVEIENVQPHPDPETTRLEVATIKGWQVVVGKGSFKTGDKVVYVPPDSVIPFEWSERWGNTRYLSNGRVKATRLRGEPSYGFCVPPEDETWAVGTNVADFYGITKYNPPVRVTAGDAEKDHPAFVRYTDVQNMRHFPDVFVNGEVVVVTEKIHGTNTRVGLVDGVWMAGSNNLRRRDPGETNWASNTYWYPLAVPGVREMIRATASDDRAVVIVFGEVYGPGIQSFNYGIKNSKVGYAVFDVMVNGKYLPWNQVEGLCKLFGVPIVPVLDVVPFSLDVIRRYAEGAPTFGGNHVREGVVVKPWEEDNSDPRIGRRILKYVGDGYLTGSHSDYTEV